MYRVEKVTEVRLDPKTMNTTKTADDVFALHNYQGGNDSVISNGNSNHNSNLNLNLRPLKKSPTNIQLQNESTLIGSIIEETSSASTSTNSTISVDSHVFYQPDHNFKIALKLTGYEIELIRTSWQEMISDDTSTGTQNHSSIASSLFCIQFYANLLTRDPNLETMFPSIKHQAVSFAGVLATAINNLESLEVLDDYLNRLGKLHARILGIDPPHFELMGLAFLQTFKDRFGFHFTLDLERCWARLYSYLANSILQFGIDPTLKVEKIDDDLQFQNLDRISTSRSAMSTFDTASVSTSITYASTTQTQHPLHHKAHFPNNNTSTNSSIRNSIIPNSSGKIPSSSTIKASHKSQKQPRTSTSTSASGSIRDEKCVIM